MNFLFVVVIRNNLHKVADCGRKIIRYAKFFVPNMEIFCTMYKYYILNTFKKCSFTLKLYHFHVTIDFGIAFGTLYSEPRLSYLFMQKVQIRLRFYCYFILYCCIPKSYCNITTHKYWKSIAI